MTLVYGAYVPNAPFLIDPGAFGGAGGSTVQALRSLQMLERYRPDTIVVSSPHWMTRDGIRVQVSERPPQIYDFSGFPPSLSQVRYEPPGDPVLARALVEAGQRAGEAVRATTDWGLDHGAWAPLLHLAPGAKTPVVPVSIAPSRGPEFHYRTGQAFRPVLEDPVRRTALIATGSILHDFSRFSQDPASRWPEGERIEREIVERALARDLPGLVGYDRRAWQLARPEGDLAPLFLLLGALGNGFSGRERSREYAFGGFSLGALEFVPTPAPG